MTKYLSDLAKGLEPYVPGEQPKDKKYIKLNTNENPYPPSRKVISAISEAVLDLRLYPDPDATEVREAVADYYRRSLNLSESDIRADNVFVGNGSDEVLAFVFPAFFKGKKIAFADITYSFYPVYSALFEIPYEILPLRGDFSIDIEQYKNGLSDDIGGLLICNPNAPTGRVLSLADIEEIIAANRDRLILVDEAYIDFGGETAVSLINKYDNLLITQTLSKSRQLAGMRIGLALGCRELIDGINRVKNSFNSYTSDRLAIAAAKAAFEDTEYFNSTRNKIIATRERTCAELSDLGFDVIPSAANFIFAEPSGISAAEVFKKLREQGVLVRYFDKPRINNRLRISIGTDEEMDKLTKTLKAILKG